jgi:(p)ppGpp synthase/HD superfamily hydrolase
MYCNDKKTRVEVFVDYELKALKQELQCLEVEFEELAVQKADIQNLINEFNYRYYQKLGNLIGQKLRVRLSALEDIEEKSQEQKETYEEAKRDYEEFKKHQEEQAKQQLPKLSSEDEQELKELYRKACKLCHPDIACRRVQGKSRSDIQRAKCRIHCQRDRKS